MSDLAHDGVDVSRIHPDVARFFEHTADLDLIIESRYRFPFSIAFVMVRWLFGWVGQFFLPKNGARVVIKTEAVALEASRDGRPNARGILRRYETSGEIMQVVLYATHEDSRRARYMSAAFPLPFGGITGILRVDPNGEHEDGSLAVVLTSEARTVDGESDDARIWLHLGPFTIRAPLSERLELWSATTRRREQTPSFEPRAPDRELVLFGRHEQRVFGVTFAVHSYAFYPSPPS